MNWYSISRMSFIYVRVFCRESENFMFDVYKFWFFPICVSEIYDSRFFSTPINSLNSNIQKIFIPTAICNKINMNIRWISSIHRNTFICIQYSIYISTPIRTLNRKISDKNIFHIKFHNFLISHINSIQHGAARRHLFVNNCEIISEIFSTASFNTRFSLNNSRTTRKTQSNFANQNIDHMDEICLVIVDKDLGVRDDASSSPISSWAN